MKKTLNAVSVQGLKELAENGRKVIESSNLNLEPVLKIKEKDGLIIELLTGSLVLFERNQKLKIIAAAATLAAGIATTVAMRYKKSSESKEAQLKEVETRLKSLVESHKDFASRD